MNVIYSMIFWGNCLPKSILKQKAQNVRIAPTNQIFHTFTDKKIFFWNSHQVLIHFKLYRKFSFTQNQKLCKFFDLWAFLFLRQHLSSRTSFQKRFLLILQNRKSPWKVPKKNTILPPKGDIYISLQGQNSLSTPSFPDLGALSQKKCLCSRIQLTNCTTLTPVSGLMCCIKRSIEHTCVVVARVCEIHFPFNKWGRGLSLLTIWNCSYAAFMGIQYM